MDYVPEGFTGYGNRPCAPRPSFRYRFSSWDHYEAVRPTLEEGFMSRLRLAACRKRRAPAGMPATSL